MTKSGDGQGVSDEDDGATTPTVTGRAVGRPKSSEVGGGGPRSDSEKAWEQVPASAEMIDDPVRMYLREIGRVSLLKAAEERILARKMEADKHIERLEDELTSPEGRAPRAWQVVLHLLHRVIEAAPLIDALSRYVAIDGERTLRQVIYDPAVRDALDGDLPEEMLNFAGGRAQQGPSRGEGRNQGGGPRQPPRSARAP